jgi:hypothetical protein
VTAGERLRTEVNETETETRAGRAMARPCGRGEVARRRASIRRGDRCRVVDAMGAPWTRPSAPLRFRLHAFQQC